MTEERKIEEAIGPHHNFWLFREGERAYEDNEDLWGREDASLRIKDDLLRYLIDSLNWIPILNPLSPDSPEGKGLDLCGVNIINREGGNCLRQICLGWAQILARGPEPLILTNGWTGMPDDPESWEPYRFYTSRDKFVAALEQLAEYGCLVVTGEYFLLHLGI